MSEIKGYLRTRLSLIATTDPLPHQRVVITEPANQNYCVNINEPRQAQGMENSHV